MSDSNIKLYGTLIRDDDTNTQKIVNANQVAGGYFVCASVPTSGTWQAGQLCYCTGDSKFYQYDGSSWKEKEFGANTWRKVQLDGTDKLGTGINTNPLNIKAGSNMTITESGGTFTFAAADVTKLSKTTYEWNKEFAAGSNGAISLGRYNIYDSQLTFDITSTTNQSLSGKLVIATQNGTIHQAKVFGDTSGALVSKLIIYQSAISNSRSWIEIFCNFNGWSKNKVHIYAVALNSATVEKQMSSVTISNGVPAASNVTSGDTKWTGTIINDSSHSHDVSIAVSSGTNELTLAHETKYALTAGGQSFIFTMPSDSDTKNTAGSTNNTNKLFLIGAESQGANPQTFSNSQVYTTDGTLYLTKTTDLSGTANNKPALIVGGTDTAAHLEVDADEIQAKASGTATAPLYLNHDGGKTYLSGEKTYSDGTYLYSNRKKVSVDGHTHSNYATTQYVDNAIANALASLSISTSVRGSDLY